MPTPIRKLINFIVRHRVLLMVAVLAFIAPPAPWWRDLLMLAAVILLLDFQDRDTRLASRPPS